MAARKRRAPSKRRVKRNPSRKYGPSTRKGGRRVSARRAYMKTAAPRRRRARRNPKTVFETPAFMFGASAVVGAATAAILNGYGDTAKAKAIADAAAVGPDATPKLGVWAILSPTIGDYTLHPGVVGAALTLGLASTKLVKSAKTRQTLVAGAVGMLAPAAIDAATQAFMPKDNPRHITAHRLRQMRQLNSTANFSAPSSYLSANHFATDLIGS
jgi:hypothetical protein